MLERVGGMHRWFILLFAVLLAIGILAVLSTGPLENPSVDRAKNLGSHDLAGIDEPGRATELAEPVVPDQVREFGVEDAGRQHQIRFVDAGTDARLSDVSVTVIDADGAEHGLFAPIGLLTLPAEIRTPAILVSRPPTHATRVLVVLKEPLELDLRHARRQGVAVDLRDSVDNPVSGVAVYLSGADAPQLDPERAPRELRYVLGDHSSVVERRTGVRELANGRWRNRLEDSSLDGISLDHPSWSGVTDVDGQVQLQWVGTTLPGHLEIAVEHDSRMWISSAVGAKAELGRRDRVIAMFEFDQVDVSLGLSLIDTGAFEAPVKPLESAQVIVRACLERWRKDMGWTVVAGTDHPFESNPLRTRIGNDAARSALRMGGLVPGEYRLSTILPYQGSGRAFVVQRREFSVERAKCTELSLLQEPPITARRFDVLYERADSSRTEVTRAMSEDSEFSLLVQFESGVTAWTTAAFSAPEESSLFIGADAGDLDFDIVLAVTELHHDQERVDATSTEGGGASATATISFSSDPASVVVLK